MDALTTSFQNHSDYDDITGTTTEDYYDPDYSTEAPDERCRNGGWEAFGQVFLPTLYSLVFVTGLLGNGLVVCVLLWFRRKCNLTDVCLLNLALADLLFVLSLPLWAAYAAKGYWPWNTAMCRLMTLLYTTGFYGSIGFMVAMTLDRYLLIVHPTSSVMRRTFKMGMVVIVAVWALSFMASLPSLMLVEVNTTTSACVLQHSWWRSFDFVEMNILGLVVPLSVMAFCYARIIPTLVRMRTQKKHKAIKLIVTIVVTFFLFWTPYHVALFLHMLKEQGFLQAMDCHKMHQLNLAMKVTETLAFSHCCLNPIIYAFAGEKFCKMVVKMLGKRLPLCSTSRQYSTEHRSSVFSRSSEVTSTKLI